MSELFERVYESRPPLIDGLLYTGAYLFVGAPKVRKSFFMAQLAYHVSTGAMLWNYPVRKSTVLYLALEDTEKRLQERLFRMYGTQCADNLHLSISSQKLGAGLHEQLAYFVETHPDTRLIIIDTLQKIREVGADNYSYGSDYEIIGKLKQFADTHQLCILIVHHTRKQQADDKFDMISGTNGLLGAADGAFLLQKEKRTSNAATLDISRRTISVMVGKGSVSHNSRKFKAENVDADRSHLNIEYCNENIKTVYHELFDESLKKYNAKQKRADRCIFDYYEKMLHSKQEKPFHEIILQIGNCDDMNAQSADGKLAKTVLDEYYHSFQERNPNLRVFSAHLHMDEATPHLHIDFVPFTTGSKRGLETRVSLKQALAAQGFQGGSRSETEWNQWVLSEKQQLAAIMERHAIAWEQKGTHEKHLPVLNYEKKMRAAEVKELSREIANKKDEFESLAKRIENYDNGEKAFAELSERFETSPEYQLPEPTPLMSARSYKNKIVEPFIQKLKSTIKNILLSYFRARDDYYNLNQSNGKLYRRNEDLCNINEKLSEENSRLKSELKDYNLLRKAFGSKQIDALLEQVKAEKTRKKNKRYTER